MSSDWGTSSPYRPRRRRPFPLAKYTSVACRLLSHTYMDPVSVLEGSPICVHGLPVDWVSQIRLPRLHIRQPNTRSSQRYIDILALSSPDLTFACPISFDTSSHTLHTKIPKHRTPTGLLTNTTFPSYLGGFLLFNSYLYTSNTGCRDSCVSRTTEPTCKAA